MSDQSGLVTLPSSNRGSTVLDGPFTLICLMGTEDTSEGSVQRYSIKAVPEGLKGQ